MLKSKKILKWTTPLFILIIAGGIFLTRGAFASNVPHTSTALATKKACISTTSTHVTHNNRLNCSSSSPHVSWVAKMTATSIAKATPTPTSIAKLTPTTTSVTEATPTTTSVTKATPTALPVTNVSSASGPVACASCWHPALNVTMQWQLSGTVDQSYAATFYDIDMFDNSAAVVTSLHNAGYKVACYIDAGTWENWRADASQFPASVKGASNGWAGEVWLDIRQLTVIGPILRNRMDQCKAKGFDAVEFDNVDGYSNDTGFSLTANDQLTFNEWLANEAHTRNLSVALKNDTDQVTQLLPYFDWALDEQCFEYNECDQLLPFINAGKPVMDVEYNLDTTQFCTQANQMNINAQKKALELGPERTLCR